MSLTEQEARTYRNMRRAGVAAKFALAQVKYARPTTPEYPFLAHLDAYSDVTGEVEGYTVRVQVMADEHSHLGDDDVTGTFLGRQRPYPDYEYFHPESPPEGCIPVGGMNTYGTNVEGARWYRPGNDDQANAALNAGLDKVAKGLRPQVLREYLEARMYDDARRVYYGVVVTVSLDGEELATSSLWGIDTVPDSPDSVYFIETAEECISEAIDQAQTEAPAAAERARKRAAKLASLSH